MKGFYGSSTIILLVVLVAKLTSGFIGITMGRSCGLSGSIEKRMAHCALSTVSSSGIRWYLVSKQPSGEEVWWDSHSKYLWSDRLNFDVDYYGASHICERSDSALFRGYLESPRFTLPHRSHFESGDEDGVREILPHMAGRLYFTQREKASSALGPIWRFNGGHGSFMATANAYTLASVRCVSSFEIVRGTATLPFDLRKILNERRVL